MTDYDHLTTFKTVLTASTTRPTLDLKQERDFGKAGTLPPTYVVATVTARSIDQPQRLNGTFEPRGHRLTTRVMSKESIVSAYELERLVSTTFAPPTQVLLDGHLVDVRRDVPGGDFDVDDAGYFFASTDWIYV